MKKRIIALILAGAMAISFAACAPTDGDSSDVGNDSGYAAEGKLFTEPTTISLMVASHPSWPYRENWPMWQLFQEATGATFDIAAIPSSDFGTKVNLLLATPEELPDMMFFISGKSVADTNGPDGAFISISDNLDKMPNYKAFWESLPDYERQDNMMLRTSGDGEVYFPPNYGVQTVGNTRAWIYRKDIFEKHGLTPPETMDELYETAKKLKELYPDSYPLCMRSGLSNINLMASQWKEHYNIEPYFDYNDNKWHYGVVEPEMKEIVVYFRKMVEEGLVPPDFLDIPAKSWEELVVTDRGFMMLEYLLRIDHFNLPVREENPEYTWAAMKPPKASADKGQHVINNQSYELAGYMICNTGDQKRIDNSIKLLDWMYSPEGIEFQSWGKEGVTYDVVDGEKKWKVTEFESPYAELGMGTPGLYQCVETAANEALYSEEQGVSGEFARPFQADRINPYFVLAFSEDLATEYTDIRTEIQTYVNEQLSKFILGQLPMEKWDSFIEETNALGVDRMLELLTIQYENTMANVNKW